jgi:hypothetical protein
MPLLSRAKISAIVTAAINGVCGERPPLDFPVIHERTVAHRLAVELERRLAGWNVDCEYNRDRDIYKMLEGIAMCDGQRATDRIFPDVIVHQRGGGGRDHNLLVVELKRNDPFDACDFRKLQLLTHPNGRYSYQHGLYVDIEGGALTVPGSQMVNKSLSV